MHLYLLVGNDVLIEFTFIHKKMPLPTGEFYRRITALVVRYFTCCIKINEAAFGSDARKC